MVECDESGMIDGGDCLFVGDALFVGLSKRTNLQGFQSIAAAFSPLPVIPIDFGIDLEQTLHLKSASSLCGPGHILIGGSFGLSIQEQIQGSRSPV